MWRKSACVVFCFLLSGCIYMGRDFGTAPIKSIESNVTTQKEIFGYFGVEKQRNLVNSSKKLLSRCRQLKWEADVDWLVGSRSRL
jgi:hypothetical protein